MQPICFKQEPYSIRGTKEQNFKNYQSDEISENNNKKLTKLPILFLGDYFSYATLCQSVGRKEKSVVVEKLRHHLSDYIMSIKDINVSQIETMVVDALGNENPLDLIT